MPKIKGTCKVCGTEIQFWPSQGRDYCSRKCMGLAHKGRDMPNKPRTGRYVPCETCGKKVWRRPHQERDGGGRFCSVACRNVEQRKNQQTATCKVCGKTWTLSASKFYRSEYCSRDCWSLARMKRPLDRLHNGKPAVVDHQGYVRIYEPGHPAATRSGWIFEHRYVMEQVIGRFLDREEQVHHLNHRRSDNRPENLQLLSASEHSTITAKENGDALREAIRLRELVARYEELHGPLE